VVWLSKGLLKILKLGGIILSTSIRVKWGRRAELTHAGQISVIQAFVQTGGLALILWFAFLRPYLLNKQKVKV
jgi:hypothetical protein